MGADYVFDPRQVTPHEVVMELTEGEGADLQVEAAGAPSQTIPEMEASMAVDARIVQIGRAAERVPMYLEHFQTHHAQVFGAQGHSGNGTFPNVIRLMASGLIDMTHAITSRYTLDDVVDAIKKSTTREDGKILVRM
jgi:threonine dehydrogenase-like Zn-dependent dehydrogenase